MKASAGAFTERRGDIAGGAILGLLGLAIAIGAGRMPFGTLAQPGAGMLPMVLGTLLAGIGAALAIRAWRSHAGADAITGGGLRVWGTLAALAVMSFAFERLGYGIAMVLFLTVLLRSYSRHGWPASLLIAGAATAAGWGFFRVVLGVALPRGVLPF